MHIYDEGAEFFQLHEHLKNRHLLEIWTSLWIKVGIVERLLVRRLTIFQKDLLSAVCSFCQH